METKKLTKEQYDALTPFKDQLRSAYKSSFVRITSSEFNQVAEIYHEVFGIQLRKSQMTCGTCRLNTMRKLGELYAKYTEEQEKKKTNKGRPKKLTEENVEKNG